MAVTYVATYEIIKVNLLQEQKINLPRKNVSYVYLSLIYCYLCYMSYSLAKNIASALIYQAISFMLIFFVAFIIDLIYLAKLRKAGEDIPTEHLLRSTKITSKIMLYPITLLGSLYGFGIAGMDLTLGTTLVVTVFLVTMSTDVFAYIFGMTIHKGVLASQLSPKKSISGALGGVFGGLVATAGVFLVCTYLLNNNPFAVYPTWKVITFFVTVGIIGSAFVQIGDLIASTIKRDAGIKDYGRIFPGHGGMMDRVDGLMILSTFTLIVASMLFLI